MRAGLLIFLMCVIVTFPATAQEDEAQGLSAYTSTISRFLFGQEELDNLKKALGGGFKKVPDAPESEEEEQPDIPRVLSLAGLIYSAPDDWSFWLNAQKVTPESIPESLQNLYVTKNYVDFEWFDEQTQKPVQLRLRPHQSFHLDTKTFFTGPVPQQIRR